MLQEEPFHIMASVREKALSLVLSEGGVSTAVSWAEERQPTDVTGEVLSLSLTGALKVSKRTTTTRGRWVAKCVAQSDGDFKVTFLPPKDLSEAHESGNSTSPRI